MLRAPELGLIEASRLGEHGHTMLDVACALVNAGWPVFPCGLDKAPLVASGFKARTRNLQQVNQWWALHPEALPAICPGDNELAALDVDSTAAQERVPGHAYTRLGLIVETAGTSQPFTTRLGETMSPRHVYVRASQAPKRAGIVIRYLAGYVIAPGARRSERVYRVISAEEPVEWSGETDESKPLPEVASVPTQTLERLERVKQLVRAIPNPLENGREPYIAMAHMIHGATGDLGKDIFLEWAAKWPGRVNTVEDERVWDTLPGSQLGFEDLWVLASRYTDTSSEQKEAAQGDFDILGPKQPEPEQLKQRVWFWLEELQSQPELLAEPTPAVPYLAWPGRKTLYAGREKAGKSTLAMSGVARVTRGEDFLGKPTMKQRVLWLTEESLADVTQRATAFGADPRGLAILKIAQDQWGDLATAFKEMAPQVVVVDSLSWFAGLGEEQENSAGAWLPVFRNFDKLTRAGVALLLLHHSVKYSEVGEYRGSTGIGANVDVIVRMKKPSERSSLRSMTAVGRMNLAQAFDVRLIDPKRGEFKLSQGVEELKELSIQDGICTWLAAHPGATVTALMEVVQRRREIVTEAVAALKTAGRIEQVGKGWTLRPDFESVEVS